MTVVEWKPEYREGKATTAILLDKRPGTGMAYVELENGKRRWIPIHWIREEA